MNVGIIILFLMMVLGLLYLVIKHAVKNGVTEALKEWDDSRNKRI